MKALMLHLLTLFYFRKYKQIQKKINVLYSVGDSKKEMVKYIRKLHLENDGSYRSSNAIILFSILTVTIKIQHCHGYITVRTTTPYFNSFWYVTDSSSNYDCLNFSELKDIVKDKFFKEDPEPPDIFWK